MKFKNQEIWRISGMIGLYHFAEKVCEVHLVFYALKTTLWMRGTKSEKGILFEISWLIKKLFQLVGIVERYLFNLLPCFVFSDVHFVTE